MEETSHVAKLPFELVRDMLSELDYVSIKRFCDASVAFRKLCANPEIQKLLEKKKLEYKIKIRIGNPPYLPLDHPVYELADTIASDLNTLLNGADIVWIERVNVFTIFLDGLDLNEGLENYYALRKEEGDPEEEIYFPKETFVFAFFGMMATDSYGEEDMYMLYLGSDGTLQRDFLPFGIRDLDIWYENLTTYSAMEGVFPVYYYDRATPKITSEEITQAIKDKDFLIGASVDFIVDKESLAFYESYTQLLEKAWSALP